MTSNKPTVGVVMPVYNGEKYLPATIESILGQTLADFEFIIVNDGSTDGSVDLVEEYRRRDSRIRVIDQPNAGISRALNAAIAHVSAPFVAPTDQDDVSLPDRLEREVEAMKADPGLVCVGGWYDIIDEKGRYLTTIRTPSDDASIQQIGLSGHGPMCHPSVMIRREALMRIGGYDPEFDLAQDLDLYLRLGELGTLSNLERPLVRYRVHSSANSEKRQAEQRAKARLACERAWARRGIKGVFDATEPYRPGPSRASRQHFALRYGWWAFNSGEALTAVDYGWKAVGLLPWRSDGWKLLGRALLRAGESAMGRTA